MFDFNGHGLIRVAGCCVPEGTSRQSIGHERYEKRCDVYVGEVFLEQACRITVVLCFKIKTNTCWKLPNTTLYSNLVSDRP